MTSLLPGMDPYLEQLWPDLHARLILYACYQPEEQLPGNLIAREEEGRPGNGRRPDAVYPDVEITEWLGRSLPDRGR
jgi:hypothetical protein